MTPGETRPYMIYRDGFERCPRCGVELVDARSARGCRACGGLWIAEQVVTEMLLAMLPPRPLSRLVLAVLQRAGERLSCPTCGTAMEATTIHDVELDRCPKHGIWFDARELELALRRVADKDREPPLESLPRTRAVVVSAAPLAPSPAPGPPQPSQREALVFLVEQPGRPPRAVRLADDIIKLGSMASAQLRIEGDDRVSRIHAVIAVSRSGE